jgi:formylglycine-generating enzyme required for sulfatase activity
VPLARFIRGKRPASAGTPPRPRAGGGPIRPDATALAKAAWFRGNAGDEPAGRTDQEHDKRHPVGKREPNPWGLYDMLGNVGEYVVRDPTDDKGLLAGGSYRDDAKDVHSAARERYAPDWAEKDPQDAKDADWLWYTYHVGFRVVMEDNEPDRR